MNIYRHLLSPISNSELFLNRYIKLITHYTTVPHGGQHERHERHHILPKSIFPEFVATDWNIVSLPLRAHYIAHYFLYKCLGGSQSQAFKLMSSRLDKKSSRLYEAAKIYHSDWLTHNNPNKDGSHSKQAWANATAERRKKQSELMTALNRQKRKPKEKREYNCTYCGKPVVKEEFCHHSPKKAYYCDAKCRNFQGNLQRHLRGRPKGCTPWNKGVPNPLSAANGRRGAKKLSKTATGRKKVIRDGRTTWAYPTDPDYPIQFSVSK